MCPVAEPSAIDLDAIRARLAKATPGPWKYDATKCWHPGRMGATAVSTAQEAVFSGDGPRPCVALTGEADDPQSMADATLIAHAPTDLAAMADEIMAPLRRQG